MGAFGEDAMGAGTVCDNLAAGGNRHPASACMGGIDGGSFYIGGLVGGALRPCGGDRALDGGGQGGAGGVGAHQANAVFGIAAGNGDFAVCGGAVISELEKKQSEGIGINQNAGFPRLDDVFGEDPDMSAFAGMFCVDSASGGEDFMGGDGKIAAAVGMLEADAVATDGVAGRADVAVGGDGRSTGGGAVVAGGFGEDAMGSRAIGSKHRRTVGSDAQRAATCMGGVDGGGFRVARVRAFDDRGGDIVIDFDCQGGCGCVGAFGFDAVVTGKDGGVGCNGERAAAAMVGEDALAASPCRNRSRRGDV